MADFGQGTEQKARKDHRCAICDRQIPAGSMYTRFTGKWKGDMQNWPAHTDCYNAHDGGELPLH